MIRFRFDFYCITHVRGSYKNHAALIKSAGESDPLLVFKLILKIVIKCEIRMSQCHAETNVCVFI